MAGVFTQGLVKYDDRKREYTSNLQGLCFTLCLVWTVIYIVFRDFWNQAFSLTTVQMLAMLVMIWASAVFNFWSIRERVETRDKALVAVTMTVTILQPALGVLLVVNAEDKVTARILGIAVVRLAMYSVLFIKHMLQERRFFVAEFWKHALHFNLPLIPHYLSLVVLSSSDRIMIQSMVSSNVAGIYNLANSVSQL